MKKGKKTFETPNSIASGSHAVDCDSVSTKIYQSWNRNTDIKIFYQDL